MTDIKIVTCPSGTHDNDGVPSAALKPKTGYWYCLSCGKSGYINKKEK